MLPSVPAAEPTDPTGAVQHWMRLSLPVGWGGSAAEEEAAEEEEEEQASWRERLRPFGRDARQFLQAYSAALIATLAFIA